MVIDLAAKVSESQEISGAELDQLSALAESAATGGVAAVEEQVTWANNLLNLNADSATISGATLDDILALSTSDFELLAANRPVVNSLLDHGLTLSNTVLALQTGTSEEISALISADPAHFALINSLLDNGISPTSVVNTYLPNAGSETSPSAIALSEFAIQAQTSGGGMSQAEADLISAFAEEIITVHNGTTETEAATSDEALVMVIELAATVSESQEITAAEVVELSAMAESVATDGAAAVGVKVTWANSLLDRGVDFTTIFSVWLPKQTKLTNRFERFDITLEQAADTLTEPMVLALLTEDPAAIEAALSEGETLVGYLASVVLANTDTIEASERSTPALGSSDISESPGEGGRFQA